MPFFTADFNNIYILVNYRIFANLSRSEYKSRVRFSFENLSKIENSDVSQIGEKKKKRNLVKYVKNKILPCRKKKKKEI